MSTTEDEFQDVTDRKRDFLLVSGPSDVRLVLYEGG